MSSVAMALAHVNSNSSWNPDTFNTWLTKNGGYADGDLIYWAASDKLGKMKFYKSYDAGQLTAESLQSFCNKNYPVIANVRGGSHWVLVWGYQTASQFSVNDPGFSTSSYSFSDMVGWRVYSP